jgi:SPX domain protein involved in polyphosphate accumulation
MALVRRHPAAFREVYPPRVVNNLYLDSPSLHNYHDHVNGAANRSKTRVRWYGAARAQIEAPTLEVKLKRGLISGKEAEPLSPVSFNGQGVGPVLKEVFAHSRLPENVQTGLQQLQPTLFNRYRRWYFLSADRRFRLTLDSELQFGPPETKSAESELPSSPQVIVEVKFEPQFNDGAARVTNFFPMRMVRCSKYVLGIERIFGN